MPLIFYLQRGAYYTREKRKNERKETKNRKKAEKMIRKLASNHIFVINIFCKGLFLLSIKEKLSAF